MAISAKNVPLMVRFLDHIPDEHINTRDRVTGRTMLQHAAANCRSAPILKHAVANSKSTNILQHATANSKSAPIPPDAAANSKSAIILQILKKRADITVGWRRPDGLLETLENVKSKLCFFLLSTFEINAEEGMLSAESPHVLMAPGGPPHFGGPSCIATNDYY